MRNLAYFSGSIHDEMDLATIIPFSSPSLNWSKQHVRKCVRDMAVISLCVWVIRIMSDQVYTVVNQFVTVRELCLSTVWTLLRTPCNEVISETMFVKRWITTENWLNVEPDIKRIFLSEFFWSHLFFYKIEIVWSIHNQCRGLFSISSIDKFIRCYSLKILLFKKNKY